MLGYYCPTISTSHLYQPSIIVLVFACECTWNMFNMAVTEEGRLLEGGALLREGRIWEGTVCCLEDLAIITQLTGLGMAVACIWS